MSETETRNKVGRPSWSPTERERGNVEAMASCGIPEESIAAVLGVDPKTLRKHCRDELDLSRPKAHALVGDFIINSILGRAGGLDHQPSRATLAIFFAKTQMGWKETVKNELTGKDGGPIAIDGARQRLAGAISRIAARSGTDEADSESEPSGG